MAKVLISTSAAGSFNAADGLLNFDAVARVQEKVAALLKKDKEQAIKVTSVYVIPRKAKPAKYSAAADKKKDPKYLKKRAIKVAIRKRVKPESLARVAIILQTIEGEGVPASLIAQIKKAAAAIGAHIKKIDKVLAGIKKQTDKDREANAKVFTKSIEMLKGMLTGAGLKETDMVISKGMMGTTVLVKLGADNVVSVGRADMTRFNAAKKALKEAAAAT